MLLQSNADLTRLIVRVGRSESECGFATSPCLRMAPTPSQGREVGAEVLGKVCLDPARRELEPPGVEPEAAGVGGNSPGVPRAVAAVADDRETGIGQVPADLVLSTLSLIHI